jgi:amicoumacin kinase
LGNFGNSVFVFRGQSGDKQILRFADPSYRSRADVLAEINFLGHLHRHHVGVASALASTDGQFAVTAELEAGPLICSSFAFAPGIRVEPGSPWWSNKFFREWGRNLGSIHKASRSFQTAPTEPKRWNWDEEILFRLAEELIPSHDEKSRREYEEVFSVCKALPRDPGEFGVIHADHAPQNFNFDPLSGKIVAFDFGNCCYHWFISDVATSLSTVARKENRETIKNEILEGYSEIHSLPRNYDDLIDLFIRLRTVYVYLDRLHAWGAKMTPDQTRRIEEIRARVHAGKGWRK